MNKQEILEDVKLSIDVDNDLSDDLLNSLINRTEKAILSYIHTKTMPEELEWILVEAVIVRVGMIGNESVLSESLEGLSATYKSDPLQDFYKYLDLWKYDNQSDTKKIGVVRFY